MNRPVNLFSSESSHYFGANSPVRNFERNVPEESSREELVLERTVPEPSGPLAIFCNCTAWFVSDLVENPEDRFSHNEAHLMTCWLSGVRSLRLGLSYSGGQMSPSPNCQWNYTYRTMTQGDWLIDCSFTARQHTKAILRRNIYNTK